MAQLTDFSRAAYHGAGPAVGGAAVTPHDTNALAQVARGFVVGGAGNVAMIMLDGTTITVPALAGVQYGYVCTHVKSTGTTATGIVALF